MMRKSPGRGFLVVAASAFVFTASLADEIVHFTNGAEMTVRAHSIENDKSMVKLDLGGNSFIAFPMSMVDKIVSAGQDVFLNPVFHPANQAVPGQPGAAANPVLAETAIRGPGPSVGFVRSPSKGKEGVMLGEAADAIPSDPRGGPQIENAVAYTRHRFVPTAATAQGGQPQVIMPPNMTVHPPTQMVVVPGRNVDTTPAPAPPPPPATAPPANSGTTDPPPNDPGTEDPPDNP